MEESMDWQKESARIVEALGLKGKPAAVRFSFDEPEEPAEGKYFACQALRQAREGARIILSKETSGCPGSLRHLGLAPRHGGEKLPPLVQYLVEGEKVVCSPAVFNRMQALDPFPSYIINHYTISPLDSTDDQPDLIVFLCNPEQASRIISLHLYLTGINPKVNLSGPTCYTAIVYPLMSGEINISLMDYVSRGMCKFDPNELFVSVPYHHFLGIVESLEKSSAGTAEIQPPQEFMKKLMKDKRNKT
jgi:uncharacterized protein (DUF169 family)